MLAARHQASGRRTYPLPFTTFRPRAEPGTDDPKLPFPARGSDPWMHNDRYDRPTDIFAGNTTLHTGSGHEVYLLLPVIPADRPGGRTIKPVTHNGKDGQIAR